MNQANIRARRNIPNKEMSILIERERERKSSKGQAIPLVAALGKL